MSLIPVDKQGAKTTYSFACDCGFVTTNEDLEVTRSELIEHCNERIAFLTNLIEEIK